MHGKTISELDLTIIGALFAWTFTKISHFLTSDSFLALMASLTAVCFFLLAFVKLINILVETIPKWLKKLSAIYITIGGWRIKRKKRQ